jgi:hypothetical protein
VIRPDGDKTAKATPPPKVVYVEKYIVAPAPARPAPRAPAQALAALAPEPAQVASVDPQALPSPDTQACTLRAPPAPRARGAGTVRAVESRAVSQARIPLTQQQLGGKIDPDYVDNQRVLVRMDNGRAISLLAPKALAVRIGDRVTAQGLYRNAALACNYIPNIITADLGPAPRPGAAPAGSDQGPAAP